jgi:hypothetical protein
MRIPMRLGLSGTEAGENEKGGPCIVAQSTMEGEFRAVNTEKSPNAQWAAYTATGKT